MNLINIITIKCNNCSKISNIDVSKDIKEKALDKTVKIRYFECKKCHKKHLVKIYDDVISEIINERIDAGLTEYSELISYERFLLMAYDEEIEKEIRGNI